MNSSEEEFVSEEEEAASSADEENQDSGPSLVKSLRDRLKKAIEEKQEYLDGWQRSRADFANYKREEAGMHSDKEERIVAELIEKLLPALDALELAVKHEKNPTTAMLEKQFVESLKKLGVERFGKVGEKFDPHRHEALAEQGTDHTVVSVERSGYSFRDKIIRPAQVII